MADMICGQCGQTGIRWIGPFSNLTHTECPHCGGINCQELPIEYDEDEAEESAAQDHALRCAMEG